MRVAPLYECVPPKLYGGTERVVSYLTEELVRQGHEVTLFASADSMTKASLRPICERALRLERKKIHFWKFPEDGWISGISSRPCVVSAVNR
ncbi:glycosyltransferase [Edaphobacter paludis]|uniref:Glycosyltransferase n=1 Tax=Edaphobacter paludis TaxID=3035702 RepID=A0AAU7D9G6_9BACT